MNKIILSAVVAAVLATAGAASAGPVARGAVGAVGGAVVAGPVGAVVGGVGGVALNPNRRHRIAHSLGMHRHYHHRQGPPLRRVSQHQPHLDQLVRHGDPPRGPGLAVGRGVGLVVFRVLAH